jgi:nucleoside 2-deoxyribosyltransferase
LKIYFAASIRGGRADQEKYNRLIHFLSSKVKVLTEHVGDASIGEKGEKDLDEHKIHQRDLAWLSASDAVVAEVTTPSLGVGYELGIAEKLNKPVLCLYENTIKDRKLSAMISGNPKFRTFHYQDLDQAKKEIVSFIESIS